MDQKLIIGGTIGYGDSNLEILFRHVKVFRLHAKLLDVAETLRAHNGKGRGYRYIFGREPNSCLLDHVIGLPFGFA